MKKLIILSLISAAVMCVGCNDNKHKPATLNIPEEVSGNDTTVYGVCGEGTAMHTLQVITDMGDTLDYLLPDTEDGESCVSGGLMAGDRMAVLGYNTEEGMMAQKVINITSLLGRWTSIDKNFAIEEGGTITSAVKAETTPWTSWKIYNGKLLLNKDTFDIVSLGADSLSLESRKGIFVYKRQI